MARISGRIFVLSALVALIAGLSCDAANAAKSDGNYFEIAPYCCQVGSDISVTCCFDLNTAEVAITNGVLKLTTTTRLLISTDGTNWLTNSFSSLWSAGDGVAFRKGFSDWPTYRAKVWFKPASACTAYLAAYSSRGKLMVQVTQPLTSETALDTGALQGRIGYILATFDGACGRLGKIGYYHNLH